MNGFINRLAIGGTIDRGKPLRFWFNGKAYTGYAGDTLASALLANGVTEIGRSVRLGRPRGIVGADRDEPNAYVVIDHPKSGESFVCATTLELYDGLRGRAATRPAPFQAWPEKLARKGQTGSKTRPYGKPNRLIPERPSETRLDTCDVLIVGGGPAGLAAARTAASTGARVVLAEARRTFGGDLLWDDTSIDGMAPPLWISTTVRGLEGRSNVRLLRNATAAGYFEQNLTHIVERIEDGDPAGTAAIPSSRRSGFRLWKLRARKVVLATGASEQILVLPNNDKPGVMLASAVRHYLRRYGVIAGRQAVVVTNNDSAYRTAIDLAHIGVRVMAVVDTREAPQSELPMEVRRLGIEAIASSVVTELQGKTDVTGVVVSAVDERGQPRPRGVKQFDCDLVCVSGGWNPDLELFNESGAEIVFNEQAAGFRPGEPWQDVAVAGAAAGHVLTRDCIQSGYDAGRDAAEALKCGIADMPRPPATSEATPTPPRLPMRPPVSPPKAPAEKWIDLSADVTLGDLEAAAKENFRTLDQIAARTGLFRGPDDGRSSAQNGRLLLGETLELRPDGLGERPVWPVRSVPLQAFAPADYRRRFRALPLLQTHIDAGVAFETYGDWVMPACYSRPGEQRAEAVRREAVAAWNGASLFDRSAEGKIEVKGRDAASFLNRLMSADVAVLQAGRMTDSYVLDDAGMIIDRCRIARFGETFLVLTGIGQGEAITRWFQQWLQLGWNALSVFITDVGAQWSAFSINGPRAARVLAKLRDDSADPTLLTCVDTLVSDQPCRIFAASTEASDIEIQVPAGLGHWLWTRIAATGAEVGLVPIGLEARNISEIQDGRLPLHTVYGARWSPIDFGPVNALVAKSADFIGKRMALQIATSEVVRPQLVGIVPDNEDLVVPAGAPLVLGSVSRRPLRPAGYAVAGQISPKLGRAVALGFLDDGRKLIGEKISFFIEGKAHSARLAAADFPSRREHLAHG